MRPDGIGIIGDGHAGRALAVYLSGQGHNVWLHAATTEQMDAMRDDGVIAAHGAPDGRFLVAEGTSEPERLAEACELILIASPASAYPEIARTIGPHLTRRHLLILYSAKLCGSLELLRSIGLPAMDGPAVVEMGSLFDCRAQDDDGVWFRGIERSTLFSAVQRSETMRLASRIREVFPDIEPADNLVRRAITEFDALAQALIPVVNPKKIERGEPLRRGGEALSERTVALLESVSHEFTEVCHAFGSPFVGARDGLHGDDRSGASRALLAEACMAPHNADCFAHARVERRSLREDVLSTLVPLRELARKARVQTPVIDEVIGFASMLLQEDFTKTGRSLEKLGWHALSHQEIVRLMQS